MRPRILRQVGRLKLFVGCAVLFDDSIRPAVFPAVARFLAWRKKYVLGWQNSWMGCSDLLKFLSGFFRLYIYEDFALPRLHWAQHVAKECVKPHYGYLHSNSPTPPPHPHLIFSYDQASTLMGPPPPYTFQLSSGFYFCPPSPPLFS